jgi:hypothetical protein
MGEKTMLYGRSQTLTATVVNATDTAVTWSVDPSQDVLAVSSDGVLTAIGVGSARVTATSTQDATASGFLDVVVSTPELKEAAFAVEGNYTASFRYLDQSGQMVTYVKKVTAAGIDDGAAGYYYADDKVYPVHYGEDNATYYYADEYLAADDGTPIAPSSFSALFNVKTLLSSSTWHYGAYDAASALDYFYCDVPASNAISALTCFSTSFGLASYPDAYVEMGVGADGGLVSLSLVTGKGEKDGVAIIATYGEVGSTALSITPAEKYFHEGGEAGDGAGSGEDF